MANKIIKAKHFFEEDFVEQIGEVSTSKVPDWGKNETLKYVGKPIPRIDGFAKVTGVAEYTFDIKLPRMAHALILGSEVPNANIKNIELTKAKELPGVLEIYTYKNAPKISWYSGKTSLFDTHVRLVGDEIACVVAETEQIALDAMQLIHVEYEKLPFVVDVLKAIEKQSPKIYDSGNIVNEKPDTYERGNVEKGLNEADEIIEDTFDTQVVVHNPTEVHCSVAKWEGSSLTIWDSTQAIFGVRRSVAENLGIDESDVRVIKKYMGGGFGGKLECGKYTIMAALLSQKLNRPIKITVDRKQMNLITGNRPNSIQKLKIGAKKDGTITALSHLSYGAAGAYPSGTGCSWPLRSMYKCENVKTEEYGVYINAGRARAFRAPGHVQGTFALESLIDEMAEKLNMDPLEFRLKNYVENEQVWNIPYTSKLLKEAYTKGAEAIQWNQKRKNNGSGKGALKRGLGMASQIWWGGGGPPAGAILKLNKDGSVRIIAGTQDLGTGTYTFMAQVVAEVLEIPIDKIEVSLGDTAFSPYCGGSGGSTTAASVSPAVRDAAEQMKEKLISSAAAILDLPEEELVYKSGMITNKDKSKKISSGEIVGKLHEQVLITTGARNKNPDGYTINTFGAQFADVEVNTETGQVKVIKIVAAHDVGRVLNITTINNQLHGGIIQGLGYALMEERIIDNNTGKVLNTNMHDYKMATIHDVPEIETIIVSEGDPLISNTGVKGVGEPAIIPTAAAVANAIYNAIGVRIKSLPITPDKILNALYS